MKKQIIRLLSLMIVLAMLSGCGIVDKLVAQVAPDETRRSTPGLMVQRIDVSITPTDLDFERHYQTQENLTAVLNVLREMSTADVPEEEPRLGDGQTYYTITATYSGGEQQQYYLLGYRYLKVGDEPWCEISFDSAMGFTRFIKEHQSDDGSYTPPPTEAPAETTLPTETGTAPTGTVPQST